MRKETEAGIDVSKDVLDVAVRRDERHLETASGPPRGAAREDCEGLRRSCLRGPHPSSRGWRTSCGTAAWIGPSYDRHG